MRTRFDQLIAWLGSDRGVAFLSGFGAAFLGFGSVIFLTEQVGEYSVAIFALMPFVTGFTAVLPLARRLSGALSLTALGRQCMAAFGFLSLGILALRVEGLVCVIMSVPLAIPLSLFGGVCARSLTRSGPGASAAGLFLAAAVLWGGVLSAPIWATNLTGGLASRHANLTSPDSKQSITSVVEIDASPDRVWEALVDFKPLPAPNEFIFKSGIAYPTHAVIRKQPSGQLIRECHFNTGPFIEPITVFEPGKKMAFLVAEQPDPMIELNFGTIRPPHLDTAFRSIRGEFLLLELPNGHTLLAGTTWFRLQIGPEWYWRLWARFFVGTIHERVLEGVRLTAEAR